jgi:hypothetical protein
LNLEKVLEGLEKMQPAVIVLVGSFISPENRELETFE